MKPNSVFVLCVTEDAGSDQKSQRIRLLSHICKSEIENVNGELATNDPLSCIWFFDISCLVHQFNLIVGSQLALMDECLAGCDFTLRYYSSLAKLTHSWRSIPAAIMSQFPSDHFASWKLPPTPCAARWGCVHELESFLIAVGVHTAQEKFIRACAAFTAKRKAPTGKSNGLTQPVDEVALDEYNEFSKRMSRYMRSATDVVQNTTFWFLVLASFTCKEPLVQCFAWLQKPRDMPIMKFVTGEAYAFLVKLQSLVTDLSWIHVCLHESGASRTMTEEAQAILVGAAVKMAAHNASAFERRMYNYVCAILGLARSVHYNYQTLPSCSQ